MQTLYLVQNLLHSCFYELNRQMYKRKWIYIITNNKRNRQNNLSACWLEIFYKMYRCSLTKKTLVEPCT